MSAILPPLPELPEYRYNDSRYNDDDMRSYALKAIAALQVAQPSNTPSQLDDWDRISKAAATACKEFGQWMPERWLQLFVAAYNKE